MTTGEIKAIHPGDGFRDLEALGWDPFFEEVFESYRSAGFEPGRVAVENRHAYVLYSARGEVDAKVSGRLRYTARSSADFPAVGDWVAAAFPNPEGRVVIHAVLPRKSRFFRKIPGKSTG
ncbi:MAG: hypothetical protein HY760_08750, partial [Nitrospirae bacterium]|nr:hypothetical protein [Nitrospirota bacterium]